MKKTVFVLELILIFDSVSFSQQDFFPLEVGNYWQFKISHWTSGSGITYNYNYMEVLKDTSFSDSGVIFKKIKHILFYEWFDEYIYLRYDTTLNSIMMYDIDHDTETIFIDNNASLLDCWENTRLSSVCITDENSLNLFDLETNYKTYRWGTGWFNASISLANVYGPVIVGHDESYVLSTIDSALLIYAKINGIEYGQFVNVADENAHLPKEFYLSQNYPNPFNPSTKISYQLPNAGNVTLKAFDVLGREVATLDDEYKNAGRYEIEFNASNLPSGVYFYQLKAGNYLETKKMMLLK